MIQEVVGNQGDINWGSFKLDGTSRKLIDVSKVKKEGWTSKIKLKKGGISTYHCSSNKGMSLMKLNSKFE